MMSKQWEVQWEQRGTSDPRGELTTPPSFFDGPPAAHTCSRLRPRRCQCR